MTRPNPVALDQARHLQLLVDTFIAGKPWSAEDRKDARLLVSLLSEHCLADERARGVRPQQVDRRTLAEKLADRTRELYAGRARAGRRVA